MHITKDGFLDGAFIALQPARGAHRSGLDAILIAACVNEGLDGHVADFGAGCGIAGLAVASRCRKARVDLFELDPALVDLADQSLALEKNFDLKERVSACAMDLTAPHGARVQSGLADHHYAHIICNPPYNDGQHRPSPSFGKRSAHHMAADSLEPWIAAATSSLAPKGRLTMIVRPTSLSDALTCMDKRFGAISIMPVHSTSERPANRLLIDGIKASNAGLTLQPALVIHNRDNTFTDEAENLLRGRAGISMR